MKRSINDILKYNPNNIGDVQLRVLQDEQHYKKEAIKNKASEVTDYYGKLGFTLETKIRDVIESSIDTHITVKHHIPKTYYIAPIMEINGVKLFIDKSMLGQTTYEYNSFKTQIYNTPHIFDKKNEYVQHIASFKDKLVKDQNNLYSSSTIEEVNKKAQTLDIFYNSEVIDLTNQYSTTIEQFQVELSGITYDF